MGSDTKDFIDRLLDTILERFQQAMETSNDNRSGSLMKVLDYYIIVL